MLKDYLKLHFIVLLWGFTAILGKFVSIPAVELVWYRSLVAAIALALLMVAKKQHFNIGRREIVKIIAMGFVFGIHWILFFASARVATVSVCLAGISTCSLWTALLEPLVNNKPLKWYELLLGVLIIIGLYVIFQFEFTQALGLVMAIGSALAAAIFSTFNGKLVAKYNHYTITLYEMVGAFIFTSLFLPFNSLWFNDGAPPQLAISGIDALWILVLSLICTVYAQSQAVALLKKMSVFAMNLVINMEPVYGILLAALFFKEHENMTAGFYVGTLIILATVLIYPYLKQFDEKRKLA